MVIMGEEIERKMELGMKANLVLHYQDSSMKQCKLKIRTHCFLNWLSNSTSASLHGLD